MMSEIIITQIVKTALPSPAFEKFLEGLSNLKY